MVEYYNDWRYVLRSEPQKLRQAQTSIDIHHVPVNKREAKKKRWSGLFIRHIQWVSIPFYCNVGFVCLIGSAGATFFFLILHPHICGIVYTCFHTFMLSPTIAFMWRRKMGMSSFLCFIIFLVYPYWYIKHTLNFFCVGVFYF